MSRNTHQKEVVLRAIRELPGHQQADAVYEYVHREIPTIGRATVYRILNQLAAQGVLLRLQSIDRADIYDKRVDQHYHFRCQDCGRVFDLDVPIQQQACAQVQQSGFAVSHHDMVFFGLCPACHSAVDRDTPPGETAVETSTGMGGTP